MSQKNVFIYSSLFNVLCFSVNHGKVQGPHMRSTTPMNKLNISFLLDDTWVFIFLFSILCNNGNWKFWGNCSVDFLTSIFNTCMYNCVVIWTHWFKRLKWWKCFNVIKFPALLFRWNKNNTNMIPHLLKLFQIKIKFKRLIYI